jgi:RNA polymerase sigma factor (sigma-70 family)
MDAPASMTFRHDEITTTVLRERSRLKHFIRRRVPDDGDAEDILQDVFHAFVEACHLPEPIEHASAWLFQVARRRIIDRFRKQRELAIDDTPDASVEDDDFRLELALPPASDGPEALLARAKVLTALQEALEELPQSQREIFIAHEIEGLSFKAMADLTGVGVNTLLARKRYAVLHLRSRLQSIYEDFES